MHMDNTDRPLTNSKNYSSFLEIEIKNKDYFKGSPGSFIKQLDVRELITIIKIKSFRREKIMFTKG